MSKINILISILCLFLISLLYISCDICEIDLQDDTAPIIGILIQEGDETPYIFEGNNIVINDFNAPVKLLVTAKDSLSGISELNLEISALAHCFSGTPNPFPVEDLESIFEKYSLRDNGCASSFQSIIYEIPNMISCPNPSNTLEAGLDKIEWDFRATSKNHAGLQSGKNATIFFDED